MEMETDIEYILKQNLLVQIILKTREVVTKRSYQQLYCFYLLIQSNYNSKLINMLTNMKLL